MNLIKKFPILVKFRTLISLKKWVSNIKFCSTPLIVNKTHISVNYEPKMNIKCNSKIKNHYTVIKKHHSSRDSASDNVDIKRNEHKYKKKKNFVSVAIVGGGSTTFYSVILLKQNPAIKVINVIDTDNSLTGPIYDIGQIDTSTIVIHYKRNSIVDGLHNIDIVAVMDETHFSIGNTEPFYQFESSSNYVKNITEHIINTCPKALVAVFTHPVTATLPLISEIYKLSGNWNPNQIIGSAALESMRISSITANLLNLNPSVLTTPIAGGVDSLTVVPLLSRTKPFNSFTKEQQQILIHQLRSLDKYLYKSETKGPTLSSGLAAAKFLSTIINGLTGQKNLIGNAYVRSDIFPFCRYMTNELQFGPNGIQQNYDFPKVSSREIFLIEEAAIIINKILNTVNHYIHTGKIQ